MKRSTSLILTSLLSMSFLIGCGVNVQETINPNIQNVNISSNNFRSAIYPFEDAKDFFPLYNSSYWKYDVYENNKLVTTLTKSIDIMNDQSIDLDKENDFYVVALKKTYSTNVKDKTPYEFFRRRNNQVAFGKTDQLNYYPDNRKNSYNPNNFRPYLNFPNSKLEKVTVKAGTFDCLKAEFSMAPLDKYTIWYAKGVGEVKRIVDSSGFRVYKYELSEFNNSTKQFNLHREFLTEKDIPNSIKKVSDDLKHEYLELNGLPRDLFDRKSTSSLLVKTSVFKDNKNNTFDVTFMNKSLKSKDNVNLLISFGIDEGIKDIHVFGEKQDKPLYNGKVVDKLPVIKKDKKFFI